MAAIEVHEIVKTYGDLRAVNGVSFEVQEGEVFGLLGPNGAGKTTTIEIMEGYRKPDSGQIRVLGLDPFRGGHELKQRVGLLLQSTSLYPELSVAELVSLFSGYYREPVEANVLLEAMGLREKTTARYRQLSGGQKQRLALILAFINSPQLAFLDEPTAGLDPQSRQGVWEWIREGRQRCKTVLLTTHYIEEAEALCDRVAIMDQGQIIALDTPRRLMADLEVEHKIAFLAEEPLDLAKLSRIPGVWAASNGKEAEYTLHVDDPQLALKGLLDMASQEGFYPRDLRVEGATLEDVFISLTGKRIRE
ncbi:MAG: ABC transporter ATP-binding protein [Anaerolineae bacterium]|nr:ABC transporter ATP-binding protein [Anaerolineae bacterium]